MEQEKFVQKLLEMKRTNSLAHIEAHTTYVAYEGTPKKHPVDQSILVLCSNPFESHKKYFEFSLDSVQDIEELESISSDKGDTAYRVRIWVQKGSLAFQTEPFIVK